MTSKKMVRSYYRLNESRMNQADELENILVKEQNQWT